MASFLVLDDMGFGKAFGNTLRETGADVWVCTNHPPVGEDSKWYLKLPSTVAQLESLLSGSKFTCVIDCVGAVPETAHQHLACLCHPLEIPCYRLLQNTPEEALYANSMQKVLEVLNATTGNVLCLLPPEQMLALAGTDITRRCYLVTEPTPERLSQCQQMGFPWENLLCLSGELSRELVTALLRKVQATVLLTHAEHVSGIQGAMDVSVTAVALGVPPRRERAYQSRELLEILEREYGLSHVEPVPAPFPLFLRRKQWRVRIFGGGSEALYWAKTFLQFHAKITVVSPQFQEEFPVLPLVCIHRAYLKGDCKDCDLVLALTGNAHVDHAISAEAKENGIPYHWRGHAAESDFLLPVFIQKESCLLALYDPSQSKKRIQALQDAL